jgi:ERCC4-type nuclease
MNFRLFVDPSELKSDSKFARCKGIKEIEPVLLPGLEERTGADILISPVGLPDPANEFLLKMHLDQGALLVQLKFSFDLIASIIDGRCKASQAKMLATGANPSQVVLLFIGMAHREKPNKVLIEPALMINGQQPKYIIPAAKNFTFEAYLKQRLLWAKRGGVFETSLEKELAVWIESAAEAAFNEPASKQVWKPKQKLFMINDWRNILINLPDLGEKKAQDIYDYLTDKSFYGFMDALKDKSLTNVPGIGLGTIKKIQEYLKGEK